MNRGRSIGNFSPSLEFPPTRVSIVVGGWPGWVDRKLVGGPGGWIESWLGGPYYS